MQEDTILSQTKESQGLTTRIELGVQSKLEPKDNRIQEKTKGYRG